MIRSILKMHEDRLSNMAIARVLIAMKIPTKKASTQVVPRNDSTDLIEESKYWSKPFRAQLLVSAPFLLVIG